MCGLASLDPVVGSEQGKTRPVLIISETKLNDILPVINIIPVTSRKSGRRVFPNEALLPIHTAGLPADSIALAYQIRTLDKRRLISKFGTISNIRLQESIIDAVIFQLGIK